MATYVRVRENKRKPKADDYFQDFNTARVRHGRERRGIFARERLLSILNFIATISQSA